MAHLYVVLAAVSIWGLVSCTQSASQETTAKTPIKPPIQQITATKSIVAESPEALIKALYQTHKANKSPFFQTKDRALIDRYFVKEIADLIWQDATLSQKTGEIAFLEADPLFNAQDMDIQDFVIHPAEIDNDGAEVLVTFTNFGEKQELTFLLDKAKGHWRISDIFYGDGSQLFQLLNDNAEEGRD